MMNMQFKVRSEKKVKLENEKSIEHIQKSRS